VSSIELLEQLKHLTNAERLVVIETATRLIREDISRTRPEAKGDQNRRLQQAGLAIKDLYEPGGELTEWTSLDAEEILDDYVSG
jgi:hypothetical protein